MIRLNDITLRRGPEPLLEGAGATLYPGHRVGLIGANGSGKSSLLAMLRGELAPDRGELEIPGDWEIAHMVQEVAGTESPAVEYVLDGDRGLRAAERELAAAEAAGEGRRIAAAHARLEAVDAYSARARAGELLHGLGFGPDALDSPVSRFSGGWRTRLALARALMCPSDLLLLDEPTNHLDLEAVIWLEQWLRGYAGTLILISHDREFLDNVVGEVLHIEHRRLTLYQGGYSAFERQRAERLAQQQALFEKQQREIAHMQRFIDRFRAKATKARAAQSRVKALERMERVAPAHVDSPFSFRFRDGPRAGNPLLALEGAGLGYAGGAILTGVTRSLRPGERIGLLGPNGAGKSTFVRALAGDETLLEGRIDRARDLRVGYFAQHQLEQLDPDASPVTHIQRLSPGAPPQRVRDFLGGFAFHGDMATDPVAPLSGGEKARLVLALLAWNEPNLLLLDEPTNHLDLEMRHALTMALQEFAGAVVLVSHDRHLLRATAEEYWLVSDGAVRPFAGDLEDYRGWLAERRREYARQAQPAAGEARSRSAAARKDDRRRDAERRASLKPLRQRVERLVHEIEHHDAELEALQAELADPSVYEDSQQERLTDLLRRQGELRNRRDALEEEWMEAESALDAARATGAG